MQVVMNSEHLMRVPYQVDIERYYNNRRRNLLTMLRDHQNIQSNQPNLHVYLNRQQVLRQTHKINPLASLHTRLGKDSKAL